MENFMGSKKQQLDQGKVLHKARWFMLSILLNTLLSSGALAEQAITPGSKDRAIAYYSGIRKILVGLEPRPGVTTLDDIVREQRATSSY